jgi:cell division septation protein DedD
MDSVHHGVSLGRVAHPVDSAGNLFILPSGVGPLDQETLLRSVRWRAMMRAFRDSATLVLLVAARDLPHVVELEHVTDGVVLVGDMELPGAQRVLARVTSPAPVRPARPAPPRLDALTPPHTSHRRVIASVLAAAAVAAFAIIGYQIAWPTLTAGPRPDGVHQDSAFGRSTVTGTPPGYAADSVTPSPPAVVVANPEDSSRAAGYAVALVTFNTAPAARAQLERGNARHLPAVTFSQLMFGADSARWYRVFTGAYASRASADSLLVAVRKRGLLTPGAGRVIHAPFALQLRANVPLADAHAIAVAYRDRGIPVYALRQADGTLTLYAGAFETPEQAALLLSTLRADGEQPAVVYRTGSLL